LETVVGASKLSANMMDGTATASLGCMKLIFTCAMQKRVLEQTNAYVAAMRQKKVDDPAYSLPKWAASFKPLDADDFKSWVG
jgi:hypothetical protein